LRKGGTYGGKKAPCDGPNNDKKTIKRPYTIGRSREERKDPSCAARTDIGGKITEY